MILIGQGGGALGGPVRALEGVVKGLETSDRLGRQNAEDERQKKLDIQREADASQVMRMREEALKLNQSQEARQVAEQDWQMKRRQIEQDQEVSARQSSAAILRAYTGEDVYDPNQGPVRPGYSVDAKNPFPPATQRALSELQQRASSLSPEETRAELQSILQAGKVGIETQSRARIKNLLKNLSTPSVNADGQEVPGTFDEQKAAQYEQMIDGDPTQGIPPASPQDLDQIESGILGAVREEAKAQAVRNMTAGAVTRLRTFQQNIEGVRQQLGPMAENVLDPEAEAEFDAKVTALEKLGPNLTPSAIAAMEKDAMASLRRNPSSSGSKSKEKPRSQWDAHDWYDRDVQNAKALGYEGQDAEAYVQRAQAFRDRAAQPQGAPQGAAQAPAQSGQSGPQNGPMAQPTAQAPSASQSPVDDETLKAQGLDPERYRKAEMLVADLRAKNKLSNDPKAIADAMRKAYGGGSDEVAKSDYGAQKRAAHEGEFTPTRPRETAGASDLQDIVTQYEEAKAKGIKYPPKVQDQKDAEYEDAKRKLAVDSGNDLTKRGGADYESVRETIKKRKGKQ